jgi:hypothetical protein
MNKNTHRPVPVGNGVDFCLQCAMGNATEFAIFTKFPIAKKCLKTNSDEMVKNDYYQ